MAFRQEVSVAHVIDVPMCAKQRHRIEPELLKLSVDEVRSLQPWIDDHHIGNVVERLQKVTIGLPRGNYETMNAHNSTLSG